jgi:glycosyltransferase involved in cell wall biosynthesis
VTSAALHVDQLWFDLPGGVGTYVRNLVTAMLARDPSLRLVPFRARFERAGAPEPLADGLPVHELSGTIRSLYPMWNVLGRPPLPPPMASAELIHAMSASAVPPAAWGQGLVVTVHDLAFLRLPELFPRRWRMLYRLGLRAAVRRADVVLTPSKSTARDLVDRTGVAPGRVRVTPLAASLDVGTQDPHPALERAGIPEPYVLFVGTLEPRKNLVTLVRAYRSAVREGLPHALVLAGPPGWGQGPLLQEIALGGPGKVVRTGWLSAADLDAVYRGASAFVYPSLYEGFGLPVLEAMARGVPAIASGTSSLPEVTGDAAIAVDPRSVDEIARAIELVAGDPDTASELGRKGRLRARGFSWDQTARLTLDAYRDALGRGTAGRTR